MEPGKTGSESGQLQQQRKTRPSRSKYATTSHPGETYEQWHARRTREGMLRSSSGAHRREADDADSTHLSKGNPKRFKRDSSVLSEMSTTGTTYTTNAEETDLETPAGSDNETSDSAWGTNYADLMNAVTELKRENDRLRRKIEALEARTPCSTCISTNTASTTSTKQPLRNNAASPASDEPTRRKTPPPQPTETFDAAMEQKMVRLIDACIQRAFAGFPGYQPQTTSAPQRPAKKKTAPAKRILQATSTPATSATSSKQPPPPTSRPMSYAAAVFKTPVPPSTPCSTPLTMTTAPPAVDEWSTVMKKKKRKMKTSAPILPPRLQKPATKASQPTAPAVSLWRKPVKPTTVLLVPEVSGTSVLSTLELRAEFDPRKLNVKHRKIFPSGAMLITCASEEDAHRFKIAAGGVEGIKIGVKKTRDPEIRIHRIPKHVDKSQIEAEVEHQLGNKPTSVEFVDYKDQESPKFHGTKLAVCKVPASVYEAATQRSTIKIGWRICDLRHEALITKCEKCKLIGHPAKHCPNLKKKEDGSEEVTLPKVNDAECIDCATYNSRLPKRLLELRRRPTDHGGRGLLCPTRAYYRRKLLPVKPTAITPEPVPTPQNHIEINLEDSTNTGVEMETDHGC